MDQPDIILGGFNSKFYDDHILKVIYYGGSNIEVKRCNDWIIKERKTPWEFPFLQFKKKPFASFDLKDDIADKQISLKAIEGNLKLPIVESSIPFDIDRKLTPEELDEVIRYCKHDVDATVELYKARKDDYIDAKALVGEMYGLSTADAIAPTNATLSGKVLGAEYVRRTDERDYVIPDNIDQKYIPKPILDFFMLIRDKSISDIKLFGEPGGAKGMTLEIMLRTSGGSCPVKYAWGGVHGAKPCVIVEETPTRVIRNKDVGSLYPNSMINFGYCSRSMKDPDAYVKLVQKRLGYKKAGDKKRANALKLVVNTVYGAMLLRGDGALVDRWAGRSVCISNQLAMTMLIVQLAERCETIDFVNINTDGIMYTIDRTEVELADRIVDEWCKVTKFEMEDDDFTKVIQKDVNNYIGIKADGSFKTKGGFVSLYKGGNFKTNSLSIIDKAVVDYLVSGTPPETTINECTDIFAFQQIIKTGGTFEGCYHYVGGVREDVQKVNRIYAVRNPKYGAIVKGKWITEKRKKNKATGKMESIPVDPPQWSESTIPECPDHCFIDNENVLTVDDLDKGYYIDIAKKRIDKYINIDPKIKKRIEKISEEVVIMATKAETTNGGDIRSANIYAKLIEARKQFLAAGIKKSGVNRFAEFKYFTLDDIIPEKQRIFESLGLLDVIMFNDDLATLTLFNADNPAEIINFTSPLDDDESLIKNPIQKLGAVETYVRRYLYMLMLDIVEADAVEAVTDKPVGEDGKANTAATKKNNRPATAEEREETKAELIDKGGDATDTQVKAIKNGLKKLRDKDDSYEDYINAAVKRIKAGLTKTDAEDLLIEIGNKVEE